MAKTIYILAENKLPDENPWMNRFKIKSNSSSSVYVVAQHAYNGYWACSCKGYTMRAHIRHCAHLKDLGIPGGEQPYDLKLDFGGSPVVASQVAATGNFIRKTEETEKNLTSLGRRKIEMD